MINFEIKNNVSLAICGRENQSGRSMIEMLGVLAIIGVLSVGGIAGYSKAMMKYRINKSIEQITLIAGNVRAFWGPQRNYDGLTKAVIKKAKLVPDEMLELNEDGSIKQINNPFGGLVGLYPTDKAKYDDKQAFHISYYEIPQEACIELATHEWSSANVKAIKVMGISGDYDVDLRTPVSVDKAIEACSKAIEEDSALYDSDIIILYFFLDIDPNSEIWKNTIFDN